MMLREKALAPVGPAGSDNKRHPDGRRRSLTDSRIGLVWIVWDSHVDQEQSIIRLV
jgi:hypothetical protein